MPDSSINAATGSDSGLPPQPGSSPLEAGSLGNLPRQRWHLFPSQPQQAAQISQMTGLSPLLAQVLLNRGIDTPTACQSFLDPEQQQLPSPLEEFPDLALSLERLVAAIETQQKIAICGDYDADGMTSTALLIRALRALGAKVDYAIPSRMAEGYGINERIVEEFYAEGVGLILTVDNGIAAVKPIARARELGIAVIVTDHHDIPQQLPPADAILNPKLLRPDSPYRGIAGVGVAYVLAVCLAQTLGKLQDLTVPLLELFTLGTIADLAPLVGVNRRWVKRGLRLLPKSRILGINALIQVAGLGDQDKTLKPEDIGFRLGPRINAVGRISDPQIVIEMLITEDVGIALERAMQCEQINQTRQELCTRIEQEAILWCETQQQEGQIDITEDRVLLVIQPDWHHGVIGIVASRLVERYGVPVFIGTYEDAEQKEIRGSARGIPEFNVFEALQSCDDLMTKYGGHHAAGGFSFAAKHLRQVKSRLINFARQQLSLEQTKPLITVDVQAALTDISLDLYQQIDLLHPCGIENPDPVFWTPNVQLLEQKTVGRNRDHLKLTVAPADGSQQSLVKAIAWRWGGYLPLPSRVDIAYRLRLNEWQGVQSVEMELIGVRPASAPVEPAVESSAVAVSSASPADTIPAHAKPTRPPAPQPRTAPKLPFERSQPSTQATTKVATYDMRERQPAVTPTVAEAPGPVPATESRRSVEPYPSSRPIQRADFYYSQRRYVAESSCTGESRELTIRNVEGQHLVVLLPERQGFFCEANQPPRPIDLTEPYYFNLIRSGLNALDLRQKNRLLLEKDELLAEKDRHIQTLMQQVALLEAKLSQLSVEQQQQFQALQSELQQQESAIQVQEAHIAQLQAQMESSPALDPQAIQQQIRQAVGSTVWFCLTKPTQKDLYAAQKHWLLTQSETTDPQLADYSEAGLRLGFAVEREVLQPFFHDLSSFLAQAGMMAVGGIQLSPHQQYTLGMLPPLLAEKWTSFKPSALTVADPPNLRKLTAKVTSGKNVGSQERVQLQRFLDQWEHPLSRWFRQQPQASATLIDQISQLCQLAAHREQIFYGWHYDLLCQQVIGNEQHPGIFHQIYRD